jgi:hypothetical protein
MLPEKPDAILLAEIFQHIARLGAIHPPLLPVSIQQLAKVLNNRNSFFHNHKNYLFNLQPNDQRYWQVRELADKSQKSKVPKALNPKECGQSPHLSSARNVGKLFV